MDISILLTAYNSGHYISDTIKSVLSQSYKDYEFIIVDDGSTDNTEDIVESFNDYSVENRINRKL